MKIKFPKVKQDENNRVYVLFYHNNKRFRLFNGSKINIDIYPNSYPLEQRIEIGHLLAAEVYKFLSSGMCIKQLQRSKLMKPNMSDVDNLKVALEQKL